MLVTRRRSGAGADLGSDAFTSDGAFRIVVSRPSSRAGIGLRRITGGEHPVHVGRSAGKELGEPRLEEEPLADGDLRKIVLRKRRAGESMPIKNPIAAIEQS